MKFSYAKCTRRGCRRLPLSRESRWGGAQAPSRKGKTWILNIVQKAFEIERAEDRRPLISEATNRSSRCERIGSKQSEMASVGRIEPAQTICGPKTGSRGRAAAKKTPEEFFFGNCRGRAVFGLPKTFFRSAGRQRLPPTEQRS